MAENLVRLTRDWLTKAAHDLQTARIVSETSDGPLEHRNLPLSAGG